MAARMSLPRFFKVIHDQDTKQDTRIPKAFANKYWKTISNPISLRLSSGDEWTISWEKRDNGDIWLQKNWKNFARLHSLRPGSVLVFDHTGESRFQVSIFNPNAVECRYDSEAPMSSLPRFFKVIRDQELKEEARIPKAIATKYWKGLPNPIFLRLKNGVECEIFWGKRDNGDVWLQNNWKNFAQFYSLKFGSLLVLDHKGESCFEVSIFNPSCVELTYPSIRREHDSEGRHDEEVDESDDDDDSVKILEADSEIITQTFKKRKTNSNGEPKDNGKSKINHVHIDDTLHEASGANTDVMFEARNCLKDEIIKEISRNFPSKNPFCVVIMSANYIKENLLVLPALFSRKHLYGLGGMATIGVGEDLTQTWDVSFKFDYGIGNERTRLRSGWKSFALDNNLQPGDACIFEMIRLHPVVTFKVHVRSKSELLQGHGLDDEANTVKRRKITDSGSPNNEPDKFEITVKSSSYPEIPQEFIRKYSIIGGNIVKLKVGESHLWDVRVMLYPNRARISGGWREFVRGCELNVGDVCVFKMVDEEKLEFEVSFIKCKN